MKHYGFENPEGASLKNLTAPTGTVFPSGTENVGEMFYRTDQNKLYVYTGSSWSDITGGGATSPAGSNQQVQYNNNGSFGADAEFLYDSNSRTLTIGTTGNNSGTIELAAGTATGTLTTNGTGGLTVQPAIGGGQMSLFGATKSSGSGGATVVSGGWGQAGQGGQVSIRSGTSGGTNTNGSFISLTAGTPTGSGADGYIEIARLGGTGNAATLRFRTTDNAYYVALVAPGTASANRIWTLPNDDPATAAGQFLTTDASGNLSFAAASGISNVVEDTTPQLGGNLDMNANDIIMPSGSSIEGNPNVIMNGADTGTTFGGNILGTAGDGTTLGGGIDFRAGNAPSGPGDINLNVGYGTTSNATGVVRVRSLGGTEAAKLEFREKVTGGSGNWIRLKAPDETVNNRTWTLPQDDPSTAAGQFLTTDASGVLSFASASATPAGSDTEVQFNDGGSFGSDADFVWSKTANTLTLGSTGAGKLASGAGQVLTVQPGTGNAQLSLWGATGTTTGGPVQISGGYGPTSLGGDVQILAGRSGVGVGADIVMRPGRGSTADGHIEIAPPTSGTFRTAVPLQFLEDAANGNGYVALVAPSSIAGSSQTWTLPQDDPATVAGQFLTTDASGVLSFAAASGGIANVVEDTTPQLGGDLDVNGFRIQNGSITDARLDLIQAGQAILAAGDNTVGDQLSLLGGQGTAGNGGPALISGGDGTVTGGTTTIRSGDGGTGNAGDIILQPGSGVSNLGGFVSINSALGATTAPSLVFKEAATNGSTGIYLRAPDSLTSTRFWTLPQDNPATVNNQLLTTNSTGILSFTGDIVQKDTTPQLGGDLDAGAFDILFDTAYGLESDVGALLKTGPDGKTWQFWPADNTAAGLIVNTSADADMILFALGDGGSPTTWTSRFRLDDGITDLLTIDHTNATVTFTADAVFNNGYGFESAAGGLLKTGAGGKTWQFWPADNTAAGLVINSSEANSLATLVWGDGGSPTTWITQFRRDDGLADFAVLDHTNATVTLTNNSGNLLFLESTDANSAPNIVFTGGNGTQEVATIDTVWSATANTLAIRVDDSNTISNSKFLVNVDGANVITADSTGVDVVGDLNTTGNVIANTAAVAMIGNDGNSMNGFHTEWDATNSRFKHHITYNDGGGNFNIRVGNTWTTTTICTEASYPLHIQYFQNTGVLSFLMSSSTYAVGDTISSFDTQFKMDSQTGDMTVPGNVVAPNVGFMIYGERGATLAAGQGFAYGNGANNPYGPVVPFDGQITYLTYSAGDATGNLTITLYVNNVATSATISPNGVQRMVQVVTPVSVTAGDSVSLVATSVTTAPASPVVAGAFFQSS